MRDRIFIDSNIWLYLFDVDLSKKSKALSFLKEKHFISTALEYECSTLYSEDMQNGQLINGTLRIQNPFLTV